MRLQNENLGLNRKDEDDIRHKREITKVISTAISTNWDYDPKKQTTSQVLMGKTEPTTYSSVGTTGLLNNDGDEGVDDTGTD